MYRAQRSVFPSPSRRATVPMPDPAPLSPLLPEDIHVANYSPSHLSAALPYLPHHPSLSHPFRPSSHILILAHPTHTLLPGPLIPQARPLRALPATRAGRGLHRGAPPIPGRCGGASEVGFVLGFLKWQAAATSTDRGWAVRSGIERGHGSAHAGVGPATLLEG